MQIIDLKSSRSKAFVAGFWRGLGAPVMVFMSHDLPEEAAPQFMEIENPAAKSDGIRGDWLRIGNHLRASLEADRSAHG